MKFWPIIKKILKIGGLGLAALVVFLILTFPFARLGPKLATQIENALGAALGMRLNCQLTGFDIALPLGVQWHELNCSDSTSATVLDVLDGRMTLLPSYQKITGTISGGKFEIRANAGLKSAPTKISGNLEQLPLKSLSPLLSAGISKLSPAVRNLEFDGKLTGEFDLPLKNFSKNPGSFNIDIKGFKLPAQPTLNLIGLKELNFTKATLKGNLSAGKFTTSDIALLSEHLSGKAEGSIELNEEFMKSLPNLTLKWKVARSDAIMSTPIGSILANSPCPSPDAENFCAKKITRMQDFSMGGGF